MSHFRPINRDMDFLMPPPSVDEWLPQRHLARFVVDVIEGLDLRAMTGSYRGSGEPPGAVPRGAVRRLQHSTGQDGRVAPPGGEPNNATKLEDKMTARPLL
jgi:hypothetical protein